MVSVAQYCNEIVPGNGLIFELAIGLCVVGKDTYGACLFFIGTN